MENLASRARFVLQVKIINFMTENQGYVYYPYSFVNGKLKSAINNNFLIQSTGQDKKC